MTIPSKVEHEHILNLSKNIYSREILASVHKATYIKLLIVELFIVVKAEKKIE